MSAVIDLVQVTVTEVEHPTSKFSIQVSHRSINGVFYELGLVVSVVIENSARHKEEAGDELSRRDRGFDVTVQR